MSERSLLLFMDDDDDVCRDGWKKKNKEFIFGVVY